MKFSMKENLLPIILAVLILTLTLVILFGVVLNEPKTTTAGFYTQRDTTHAEAAEPTQQQEDTQEDHAQPAVDEALVCSDWVETLPPDVQNNRYAYDIEEKVQYSSRVLVASETQSKYRTRTVEIKTGDWKKGVFDAQSYIDRDIDVVEHISEMHDGINGFRVKYKVYHEWSEWQNGVYEYDVQEADGIQIQMDYVYEYGDWSDWSDIKPAETPEGIIKERIIYKYSTQETALDDREN